MKKKKEILNFRLYYICHMYIYVLTIEKFWVLKWTSTNLHKNTKKCKTCNASIDCHANIINAILRNAVVRALVLSCVKIVEDLWIYLTLIIVNTIMRARWRFVQTKASPFLEIIENFIIRDVTLKILTAKDAVFLSASQRRHLRSARKQNSKRRVRLIHVNFQ